MSHNIPSSNHTSQRHYTNSSKALLSKAKYNLSHEIRTWRNICGQRNRPLSRSAGATSSLYQPSCPMDSSSHYTSKSCAFVCVSRHIKSRQRKYNHNCHLGQIPPLKLNFLGLTTLSNACARHIEHHEV